MSQAAFVQRLGAAKFPRNPPVPAAVRPNGAAVQFRAMSGRGLLWVTVGGLAVYSADGVFCPGVTIGAEGEAPEPGEAEDMPLSGTQHAPDRFEVNGAQSWGGGEVFYSPRHEAFCHVLSYGFAPLYDPFTFEAPALSASGDLVFTTETDETTGEETQTQRFATYGSTYYVGALPVPDLENGQFRARGTWRKVVGGDAASPGTTSEVGLDGEETEESAAANAAAGAANAVRVEVWWPPSVYVGSLSDGVLYNENENAVFIGFPCWKRGDADAAQCPALRVLRVPEEAGGQGGALMRTILEDDSGALSVARRTSADVGGRALSGWVGRAGGRAVFVRIDGDEDAPAEAVAKVLPCSPAPEDAEAGSPPWVAEEDAQETTLEPETRSGFSNRLMFDAEPGLVAEIPTLL